MKLKYVLICLALFALIGCGNDNSTSSNPTPPAQSITGTYKLSSASGYYLYQSGVLSFDYATSITGTLIIGQESWSEVFVVDGGTLSRNGTYVLNYTTGTVNGTIGVLLEYGAIPYSFSIDAYNLNIVGSPNSTWIKVSDEVTY